MPPMPMKKMMKPINWMGYDSTGTPVVNYPEKTDIKPQMDFSSGEKMGKNPIKITPQQGQGIEAMEQEEDEEIFATTEGIIYSAKDKVQSFQTMAPFVEVGEKDQVIYSGPTIELPKDLKDPLIKLFQSKKTILKKGPSEEDLCKMISEIIGEPISPLVNDANNMDFLEIE